MHWLLLISGVALYLIVRYRVAPITSTPVWLLWFVLMIPALMIAIWFIFHKGSEPLPRGLLIISFGISALSYIALVQAGRKPLKPKSSRSEAEMTSSDSSTSGSDASGSDASGSDASGSDASGSNASDSGASDSGASDSNVFAPNSSVTKTSQKNFLDAIEEGQLKQCFSWSTYYLKNLEYRPQAVVCRGQLRTEPEKAYETIQKKVAEQFGDRFLVVFQSLGKDETYFVIVPNPQFQSKTLASPIYRPGIALVLLVATLLTTSYVGLEMVRPDLNPNLLLEQPELLRLGLPYGITLMLFLGVHELGHFFASRHYRLKASLPYFIPFPHYLGTFGAFVQVQSPMPNRKTLFDVGIAGPIAGLMIAVPALLWGLVHSELVVLPTEQNNLPLQAFDPKQSLLFFVLSKAIYGAKLSLEQGISLHPVAIAGGLGLAVTAINLMPVGQLDGGHIIHAMFGQRKAAIIGHISRLLLLPLAFVQPILLIFAIFLLFMPVIDQPALNDVSELDDRRDLLGLIALGFLLSIILPIPSTLAHLLAFAHP